MEAAGAQAPRPVDPLTPPRVRLALALVVDVALNARPRPVSTKALALRHGLPPRSLEPLLQVLVRRGVLKGVRGPHGGYELARERRRVSAGAVARAVLAEEPEGAGPLPASPLATAVTDPLAASAASAFLAALDAVSVEDLCGHAVAAGVPDAAAAGGDFAI